MFKKQVGDYLVPSITIFFCFLSFLLSLSLGTQNTISILKQDIISESIKYNESVFFSINYVNQTIEEVFSEDDLYKFKNKFYSAALASRFYGSGLYLSVTNKDSNFNYNISLLESKEKPLDSDISIIHGSLPVKYSESIKVGDYYSKYGFLTSTTDALYIPEQLVNTILNDFEFQTADEILYSDYGSSSFQGKVVVELKSIYDKNFSLECRLRGVYSNNDSSISSQFNHISNQTDCVVIGSEALFNNLKFPDKELMVLIKPNSNEVQAINSFFDYLDTFAYKKNMTLNFSYIQNEVIRSNIIGLNNSHNESLYNRYAVVFLVFAAIISIGTLALVLLKYRDKLPLVFVPLLSLLSLLIIFFNSHIKIPSKLAMYYFFIVYLFYVVFITGRFIAKNE